MQLQDRDTIVVLSDMFEATVPELLNQLKASALNEDWDTVHFLAHKLKSTLGVIQIHCIYRNISTVETRAKEKKDLNTIITLVENSGNEYRSVMPAIRHEIEKQMER